MADEPKMIPVSEFKNLRVLQLMEQIRIRKKLINTMVGTLYPRIVADEIASAQEEIERKQKGL